jgi:hypothetical protein
MGKSTTPKHVFNIVTVLSRAGKVSHSTMAWKKEYGRPTTQNIDKWVTAYEDSCKPGGFNDHLGHDPVVSCEIRLNPGKVVASWVRKTVRSEEPMFQIV